MALAHYSLDPSLDVVPAIAYLGNITTWLSRDCHFTKRLVSKERVKWMSLDCSWVTWPDLHTRYQFLGHVRVMWLSLDHHLSSAPHWGWWDAQSRDSHEQSSDIHFTLSFETSPLVKWQSRDSQVVILPKYASAGTTSINKRQFWREYWLSVYPCSDIHS